MSVSGLFVGNPVADMQSLQPQAPTGLGRTTQLSTVEEIVSAFEVSAHDVRKVTNHFVSQMRKGLQDSSLPYQLPAYVTKVPDGSEKGVFLSVDLGGTNCRICLVDLHGEGKLSVSHTKYAVPTELMVNQRVEPLFTWVAGRISEFIRKQELGDSQQTGLKRIPLGFTFSFTCEQLSLESGKLLNWDKGWDIPEAVGKDPCAMLQESIDKMELPVQVSALANDSVGTLLARAYTNPMENGQMQSPAPSATVAAVIIGTGTNAAYVEQMANISRLSPTLEGSDPGNGDIMIVNTEWGSFDDNVEVLPRNTFDDELDFQSTEPCAQMMEKRVSGMYLSELFRLVVLHLVQRTDLRLLDFTLESGSPVVRRDGVECSLLSLLADDSLDVEIKKAELRKALAAQNVTTGDVESLQRIAVAIGLRAARLAGAALAAVLIKSGRLLEGQQGGNHAGNGLGSTPPSTTKSQMEKNSAAIRISEFNPSHDAQDGKLAMLCGLPLCSLLCDLLQRTGILKTDSLSVGDEHTPEFPRPEEAAQSDGELNVVDIGVDGSVIEFFPDFEKNMRAALREVPEIGTVGENRIRIGVTRYGSAVGAALMAQAAVEQGDSDDSKGSRSPPV